MSASTPELQKAASLPDTNEPRLIVADVDVGIDDAWALFMLLKAETAAHPVDHRLLAVTCVGGNTNVDQVAYNVARVMHCARRSDVPVYVGAASALVTNADTAATSEPPYHGHDGLGDVADAVPAAATTADGDNNPTSQPDLSCIDRSEHAVNALHRLVGEHPDQVTLVCCAPLTNVALAVRMYGPAFVRRVRALYLMGGNYLGVGNVNACVCAEFNFYSDPEAAAIVLEAFGAAGVPVCVLPWEACTSKTLSVPLSWRWNVLGRVRHPIVDWLNPVERSIFGKYGDDYAYGMCDALLVGCLLFPERLVKRVRRRRCTVELQGRHTRGQMVVDHVNGAASTVALNVWMVERLEAAACMELMLWTVDAASVGWGTGGTATSEREG